MILSLNKLRKHIRKEYILLAAFAYGCFCLKCFDLYKVGK